MSNLIDTVRVFQESRSRDYKDRNDMIIDADWVKASFMVSDKEMDNAIDVLNRYWTSADLKFTDTTPGGNIGINARPQFCPYSDIPHTGKVSGREDMTVHANVANVGMGRYYSEAIDDNAHTIYLSFGVKQHNSLFRFLTLALDHNASYMARTGRGKSLGGWLGTGLGIFVKLRVAPILSILQFIGNRVKKYLPIASSQYYTVKPTPHMYWSMVNTLVTNMAVNMGILPTALMDPKDQRIGAALKLDQSYMDELQKLMPDIVTNTNYIDVFAIANKAQRLANKQMIEEFDGIIQGRITDYSQFVQKRYKEKGYTPKKVPFEEYVQAVADFSDYYGTANDQDEKKDDLIVESDILIDPETGKDREDEGIIDKFVSFMRSDVRDGARFAIFRVDYAGEVSETVSTSVKDAGIASVINRASESSRTLLFNLGGGNLGNNVVADFIEGAYVNIRDFIANAAEQITFGLSNIVTALAGGGYINVPKDWEDTTVTLPKANYSMTLISPYGNPVSRLINIAIPLAMIMAGSFPVATGKQSYYSPLLCSLFDRGRVTINTGIIDSVTITRGVSNLGFNKSWAPLAIKVDFSILNLSSLMTMPIAGDNFFGVDISLDEDNMLQEYLHTLAGTSLYDRFYITPVAKSKLAKDLFAKDALFSPARAASWLNSTVVGDLIQLIARDGRLYKNITE